MLLIVFLLWCMCGSALESSVSESLTLRIELRSYLTVYSTEGCYEVVLPAAIVSTVDWFSFFTCGAELLFAAHESIDVCRKLCFFAFVSLFSESSSPPGALAMMFGFSFYETEALF